MSEKMTPFERLQEEIRLFLHAHDVAMLNYGSIGSRECHWRFRIRDSSGQIITLAMKIEEPQRP